MGSSVRLVFFSLRRIGAALCAAASPVVLCLAAPGTTWAQEPVAPQIGVPIIPGLESASVNFDAIEISDDGSTITFSGYVDIDDRPRFRLQADHVVITLPPDPDAPGSDYDFTAIGNVSLMAGEVLLNGTEMTGRLRAGTGRIKNAFGLGPGDVYFRGEEIEQIETGVFRIQNGVVTPCTQALPIWEFQARTFDLYANDHVTMKVPVFKVKGVPLIILPALYWPIDEGRRSTGLLLPGIGTSTRKGFMYSQPFFWAINRSMDATLTFDYYAKARAAFSGEYRHRLTANSQGGARFFWLQGTDFSAEELADPNNVQIVPGWTLDGDHTQNFAGNWRLNANASFFSSKEFIQGFEDNFNRFLRRNSSAGMFLTRNWSSYTLNLVADHNETFFGNTQSVVRQRQPEVEFRVRRRPLAGPLYYQFQGSFAGLLRREQGANIDTTGGRYQRLDALPEVSLAFTQIPWLTVNPFLEWRSTWYSQRTISGDFEPDPLSRNVYETGVQVIGPSIFRIFDTPTSNYSPRFKHIIEPRFTWGRQKVLDEENFNRREIIQFDEIDRFGGDRHFARASLINRFLAKRFPSSSSDQRSVWEVFSVEFARDFDLRERDPDILFPSIPVPWSLTSRVTPTPLINFSGRVRFTPQWKPADFTVAGTFRSGPSMTNITWFRNARTSPNEDDPSIVDVLASNRLTGSGRVNLLRDLVTVTGNLTWDVSNKILQAMAIGATWNTQCCSIGGQFRNINFSFRSEKQFSILVELLNVGSMGFGSER